MPTSSTYQTVNIGNQSNDGTGDSIRDAFGKVNSNFGIIFAAAGIGDGLYFTSLNDAPSTLGSNQIIITDPIGNTLTQATLVGGQGISVGVDYANHQIIFTNTNSSLFTDSNPTLSTNLDGNTFRATNFGDPEHNQDLVTREWLYQNFLNRDSNTVTDTLSGPVTTVEGSTLRHNIRLLTTATTATHLVNKAYTDQKISLAGTSGIDSATGSTNTSFGQMTGALELFRDPIDSDSPLIAATKHYVDNNGYYSANNLYVTMKGRDYQPDIPAYKRGRFYQYAFATLNRAAQYAEELIATSRIEVGDYARLITYNSGTPATVTSVTDNYSNTGLTRLVVNAGAGGSDQFGSAEIGKFTIFPGQYIEGVDSKAIGMIEDITTAGANQEVYTMAYVDYATNFSTNITTTIPNGALPNQVLFTFVESKIVPIPDFWVGYKFYVDTNSVPDTIIVPDGTILSIISTADVNGNYTDSFLVEFTTGAPGTGQTFTDGNWHVYSGDFIPGETLLYNTNVSSLQISFIVESGEYYEQLPIKLAANTSIRGDEFRRVIIRPAAGVSTSPWATTYFRRDTQIDGLQIVPLNTSTNYATTGTLAGASVTPGGASGDIVVTLSTGSISSAYKGYMFVGGGGQGVVTECNGSSFNITVDNNGLTGTNTISAGGWAIYKPTNFGYHYLVDPTDVTSSPKLNSEMDVFLMNDATIIRYVSVQNHGGFMKVLDPVGQIKNKSPYTQTASSFSQSIAKQAFRGGMFVDGFAGNLEVFPTISAPTPFANPLRLTVNGLIRKPQVPTFFVENGIRYEIDFFSNFAEDAVLPDGTQTYAATLNLNPLTPGGIPNTVGVSDATGGFKHSQLSIPISIDAPAGVGGIAAAGYATSDNTGKISSVVITFPGTGYITTPTISIGGAVINNLQLSGGNIIAATIAYSGQGYAVGTIITFTPIGTLGVTAATGQVTSVNSNGGITGFSIIGGGTNWTASVSYQVKFGNPTITVPTPVAGYIDVVPDHFELITAGNRSMLANDFTQINDLGYGIFVTNGGFAENVSMFTYYCYRSYYALNGSQVRSTTGSSCYGQYGLCAEGSDPYEVPIGVNLSYPLTQLATAYVSYPLFPAIAGQTNIYVQVDPSNGGFPALGSSQIEINHSGIIKTYSIGSAVQALDSNNNVIPNVYELSFNTGNLAVSSQVGLLAEVANGTAVTCRAEGLHKFYGINPASLSRPSTVLTMNDDPTNIYHVTSYSAVQSDNAVFIYTLENYNYITLQVTDQGVTYPKITNTGSGYTTATVAISSASVLTNITHSVLGTQGTVTAGIQVVTLNSVSSVVIGQTVSGSTITTGTSVTYVNTSTNQIGINIPTSGVISSGTTLTFTGLVPTAYPVITSGHISGVVVSEGGTGWSGTTTTISISGDGSSAAVTSPIIVAGVTGSHTIKITPLDAATAARINAGLLQSTPTYFQFGFNGQLLNIIAYRPVSITGQIWAEIDVDQGLNTTLTKGTTLYAGVPGNSAGKIITRLSLMRATGHDFVDVGTGGYATTRIPNDLYGPPIIKPQQVNEISEKGPARVYYATTDQDGNFRVGTAFLVNQAQGSVSINAPLDLSNLSSISLKKDLGPPINEFSTDDTMVSEALYKVPTESAVVGYINRRLGLDRSGNVYTGAALGPQFMSLSGQLAMKGAINMGVTNATPYINNLQMPSFPAAISSYDAVNRIYADGKINRAGIYSTDGYNISQPNWGVMTGPLQLSQDPTTSTVTVTSTGTTSSLVIAIGTGTVGLSANMMVSGANIATGTLITQVYTNGTIQLNALPTGVVTSGTVLTINPVVQAATKRYVDASKQVSRMVDVLLTGTADKDFLMFNSTILSVNTTTNPPVYSSTRQLTNVAVTATSDVAFARSGNTLAVTIVANTITNAQINSAAAIAYSKLNLSNSIVNADVSSSAAIAYSKLNLASSVTNSDLVNNSITVTAGAGLGVGGSVALGSSVTLTNTGVTGLTGTANRVTVNQSTGSVTLNLPQDIHTGASPTFSGLTLSSLTASGTATINGTWILAGGATLQATYADLAERYTADTTYEPGTVVIFGGVAEVTISTQSHNSAVAGVVSTEPAYLLNAGIDGVDVALQGRVPCKVVGKIKKGDLIVTSHMPGVATVLDKILYQPGCIIGKALADYDSTEVGVIEVAVGRL